MSWALAALDKISYGPSPRAWQDHSDCLHALIRYEGIQAVLELGGGANPALTLAQAQNQRLDYAILDISREELDKAPAGYRKICADLNQPMPQVEGDFDLIFSKMLAEHVRDGAVFHKNVFNLLRPGGYAFHFFPTLYAPPFLANKLLPERLAQWVLDRVNPRDKYQHAKFPAYYSWCRGPTAQQMRRLESVGFEIYRYIGFFGHESYYRRLPLIRNLHRLTTAGLLRHPVPWLTSFAYLILRKPVRP